MKYAKASPADLKGIVEILIKNYNIKTRKEALRIAKEEISKGYHYLIAKDKGKIVGMACWSMQGQNIDWCIVQE